MDHLTRTPLLLEFSHASAQHGRPGGSVKARDHRIRQKTSASMPRRETPGERVGRKITNHIRFNRKRDQQPAQARRAAETTRMQARTPLTAHVHKQRKNPNARADRLLRRGNPQAPKKTEIRKSPSKSMDRQRPTLPQTPKFFSRTQAKMGRF